MKYRCFVCDSNDPCILSSKSLDFFPVFCPYDEDACPIWDKSEKIAKNTEQLLQPGNGQKVCTHKGCAGYSNGFCISFENCPEKSVSG